MHSYDGLGACGILMFIIGIVVGTIGLLLDGWGKTRKFVRSGEEGWSSQPRSIREFLLVYGFGFAIAGLSFLFLHMATDYP